MNKFKSFVFGAAVAVVTGTIVFGIVGAAAILVGFIARIIVWLFMLGWNLIP